MKPEDVALWLVVGFKRSWLLRQVVEAAGLEPVKTDEQAKEIHRQFPFLPGIIWSYVGHSSTPVRAFISAEWPRLFAYLDKNASNAEKLAKAPAQIVRLQCRDLHRRAVSVSDQREMTKAKGDLRRANAGRRAVRSQRESTSRSAWNVCKK